MTRITRSCAVSIFSQKSSLVPFVLQLLEKAYREYPVEQVSGRDFVDQLDVSSINVEQRTFDIVRSVLWLISQDRRKIMRIVIQRQQPSEDSILLYDSSLALVVRKDATCAAVIEKFNDKVFDFDVFKMLASVF